MENLTNRRTFLKHSIALAGLASSGNVSAMAQESPPRKQQEVILRAVSAHPEGTLWSSKFEKFVKRVNEEGKGLIRLTYLGGAPKVMPPFDVGRNLREGIIHIANNTGAYYTNIMPEGDALKLLEFPMSQLRSNGGWELIDKLHQEKMNAFYLARVHNHDSYHIYLRREITKPDLTGLKIRVSPVYRALVEKLGGAAVTSSPSEIYTLMERNTVDGYGHPARGLFDYSLEKVTRYRIDPGFYNVDVHFLVNRAAWNGLNDNQRQLLQRISLEMENSKEDVPAIQSEVNSQDKAGIKSIRFTENDERTFMKVARDAAWKSVIDASPQYGARLREFFERKS